MIVATSGGTSGEWTNRRYQPADLWAYAKVKQKSELLPSDVDADETIDFFVNRGLDQADLTASDVASPRSLVRRETFDLTGLSPSPDQIDAFEIAYIYAYHVRGQADPFTELLNSDLIVDRSIALALRLEQDADTLPEQIDRTFRLVLGRHASRQETQWMTEYVNDMRAYHDGVTPERPEYPEQITRSLVEEFSGEPFEYKEILPGFASYQPDTKPSDMSPRQRAIADMCLLLFNSNEFMYVD